MTWRLGSGAGHDAMAMQGYRRHRHDLRALRQGRISHNPAESITAADAETGARVLLRFIRDFEP